MPYRLLFFGGVAAVLALVVWGARRLRVVADLRAWQQEVTRIDPAHLDLRTSEGQRQRLVWLYAHEEYVAAAEYAATLSDEVLKSAPCERLADMVKHRQPEVARRLYRAAIEQYWWEGRQATGSGEGLQSMDGVKRLEAKLKKVKG